MNILDKLINFGYVQHKFNGNDYMHCYEEPLPNGGTKQKIKSKEDYYKYKEKLLELFNQLAVIAEVDMVDQTDALNIFESDKRFYGLSFMDKIKKLKSNCRLAFGKIYEYLSIKILNKYNKEAEYNNSGGKNIIDLSFCGDKKIFDIRTFSNKYQKYVGADVKYCTKFFNKKNVIYNTCLTKEKILDMALFYTKEDMNIFINKSYMLAIVPTAKLSREEYVEYGFRTNPKCKSMDDFIFVVYLDKLITDDNELVPNIDDYIVKVMTYEGKDIYGIKTDSDAVHTISEFVNDVL